MESTTEDLLELARSRPLLRARDVRDAGISTALLSRLVAEGRLERVGRGVYRDPETDWDEHTSIATVAAIVPRGVIVLLSALNFHGIGTHQANAIWIQLPINATQPKVDYPPIEVVRTRVAEAFTAGVEEHDLNGIKVRITDPARTVADCFKHRNKFGLELCLEALRETVPSRAKPAEVLTHARMNRVERIVLPYLELLA